jgi:hypothetical protein
MLSDTDAKNRAADVEGEIREGSSTVAAEESGQNLAGVNVDPQDLVILSTCFMDWSLMTQFDFDAVRSEGCFEPRSCQLPRRETIPKS